MLKISQLYQLSIIAQTFAYNSQMTKLQFTVKHLNIGAATQNLQLLMWNYVAIMNYVNMEDW